ncbi:MAG: 2'-5' RNA ligase family protein [Ottowia sp.]|nr:2'-5' RNA ligase family protein [Ottowia sp.]
MTDQFSLFTASPSPAAATALAPPAPGRSCDLFFALLPAPEDAHRISEQAAVLRESLGLDERAVVGAQRLHVSLHSLGSHGAVPDSELSSALAAASQLKSSPFDVCFDRVLTYGRGETKALVLDSTAPMTALHAFHRQLGMALADAGMPAKRTFTPHMTLSRHDAEVPAQALVAPLCWCARRLVLIWSHVGRTRYELAGEWPLGA